MKTLKVLTVTTLLGLAAFGLSSCSSAQKGAAGGGLVGGAAGLVLGNNIPGSTPAAGAAIGGGSGIAIGGLAGDAYDQVTEADVERELENLRAELIQRENELAALRDNGIDADGLAKLEAAQTEIESLQAQLQAAQARADEMAMSRSAAEQELSAKTSNVSELQDKLAAQAAAKNALNDQIAELQDQIDKLGVTLATREEENARLASSISEKEAAASELRTKIQEKETQLQRLNGEVDVLRTSLTGKEQQLGELSSDLEKLNVQLDETSRGLTLTIVDSLLYKPGEAELTSEGRVLVGDVAKIIKTNFPDRELLVEGHTDNVPIKHSGWRSNWELGAGRALTLLHELVENQGVDPAQVSATSYGEFRPAASNATAEGRTQNRRAVIVILPEKLPLQRENLAQAR